MNKLILFLVAGRIPFAYSNQKPTGNPQDDQYGVTIPYLDSKVGAEVLAIAEEEGLQVEVKNGLIISESLEVKKKVVKTDNTDTSKPVIATTPKKVTKPAKATAPKKAAKKKTK